MIQEILKYKETLNNLSKEIEESPIKTKYIFETLQMTSPTFYRKLKSNSFTPDELLQIARIIKPDEYLDYMIKQSQQDYKEGRVTSHSDVMKILREKYL